MVASSPNSTSMESKTTCENDDLVQAVKLLANGKRNTVMRNMTEAVSQLELSCQLFVNTYGEKSQECGEVYLAYGTALLELARMESGVLGNALQGIKEKDDELECEDTEENELDSSKLNADSDVKMTEEESEQLTENIVNAMTEEEREFKLEGEEIKVAPDGSGDVLSLKKESLVDSTDKGENVVGNFSKTDHLTIDPDAMDVDIENDKSIAKNNIDKKDIPEKNDVEDLIKKDDVKLETATNNIDKSENCVSKLKKVENDPETVESKSETVESKSETVESKSDTVESKSEIVESKSEEVESKSEEVESKSEEVESKSEEVESKSEEVESKLEEVESKMEVVESKAEEVESKPEEVESKPEEVESKPEEVESKAEEVESKMEVVESKAEEVESKAEEVESKAEEVESKMEEVESKAENGVEIVKNDDQSKSEINDNKSSNGVDMEINQDIENIHGKRIDSTSDDKVKVVVTNEDEDEDEDIADEIEEEDDAEEADEEDISNLQLAWEVLEVARNIYTDKKDKENEMKLSEVYNKLGELGIEGEQYSQAIEDFESSLVLQLKHFSKDDRRLAHTHYQLGIVYAFDKHHDRALSSMRKAISGLKDRNNTLLESKDQTKEVDKIKTIDEELDEIKSILPDIDSKIKDVEDDLKNMKELKEKIIESATECGTTTGFGKPSESSKNAVVNQLVVRKKRKASDEEVAQIESSDKKLKQEVEEKKDVAETK